MSLKLFSVFVKTLKHNLPWRPVRPGFQLRHIAAMETDTIEKPVEEKQEIVPNKNLTRFKKRYNKRQWDDPSPRQENGETDPKRQCERIKRKKMAMILGYSGVNYHGMQRNPGVPTIEEDLLKALYDAKYITEEDFTNQQSAQFQRSSRTDKGVSAARQIVSLKLPLEISVEEINKRLPECIRVFGVKRVTNRFNSKSKCNARTYSYTLPTFVFEPSLESDEERKGYRISADKLQKVNDVLAVYKGTKSYHNFTEKKHHQDPSSLRYMMGFSIEKVFVTNDMEFAVLLVKGQSFMLHQIRKMVGLMIAVLRGQAEISIMDKAFGKEKVMIPTAPGLGLVLDKVHYERYDAKFKDSHDSLTWEDEEEAIQKFKHDYIYPNIVKGELEGNMATWLEKLSRHSFEPSEESEKTDEQGDDDDDGIDDGDDDDDDLHESVKCDGVTPSNNVTSSNSVTSNNVVTSSNVVSSSNVVTSSNGVTSSNDVADLNNSVIDNDVIDKEAKSEVDAKSVDVSEKCDVKNEDVSEIGEIDKNVTRG